MNNKKKLLLLVVVVSLLTGLGIYIRGSSKDTSVAKKEPNSNKKIVRDISDINNDISTEKDMAKKLKRENDRLKLILEDKEADKVAVLSYNHIYKEEDKDRHYNKISKYNISEKQFKEEMQYLYDNNYYVATLDELVDFKKGYLELPRKTVVLVFENGYDSLLDIAYPILEEFDFYVSVFLTGKNIEDFNKKTYPDKINYLDYDDLKLLSNRVDVQSKSYNLFGYIGRSSAFRRSDKDIVNKDFDKAIDSVGASYFMYSHDEDENFHEDILLKKGFKLAFTMKEGYLKRSDEDLKVPRFIIRKGMTLEDFIKIVKID